MRSLSCTKTKGTTVEDVKEGKQCGGLRVLVKVWCVSVEGGLKNMKTSEQTGQLGG